MDNNDKKFLDMTIGLAEKALGDTSPNPLVGCVIVKAGKIISRGYHKKCGQAHAEINAIEKAGKNSVGASLYVNLEPCAHYGRTGPCAEAIIKAGIRKVFIGIKDPNHLTCGKGIRMLRKAGITVELAKDKKPFEELNEIFIKHITTGHPFIAVKAAQSIDGKIATRTFDSKWITGKHSRCHAQFLRKKYDAIMVGVNTVLQDNPYLSCRYGDKLDEDAPVKIIVDSTLRTPANSNIFSGLSPAPVIIATTERASKNKIKQFNSMDVDMIICPQDKRKQVDLEYLVCELGKHEITSILVEGGGRLNGSFFDAKLADKIYFFVAPKIIGGDNAVNSVGALGINKLDQVINIRDIKYTSFGDDLLAEGRTYYENIKSDKNRKA